MLRKSYSKDSQPIVKVAKKVCPAAITIVASKDLPKIDGYFALPFGNSNVMLPKFETNQKERTKVGGGSGFIVSPDGYIVTCNHVVADSQCEYTVLVSPGQKYSAKILAKDPLVDLAILKIDATKLPYLDLGDSNQIDLGETVVAVGNPLGEFDDTISAGIISGLSRKITAYGEAHVGALSLRGLIQTDAAINPGNSGGPLTNLEGKVVGINSAMVAGAENIGFAIPINYAKVILDEIKKFGKIKRPFLGIRYLILNENIAKTNQLPVNYGALIFRERLGEPAIIKDSPADQAGLQEFDIILECNGQKITEENTLNDIMQRHQVGDELQFMVLREEKELQLAAKLQEKE